MAYTDLTKENTFKEIREAQNILGQKLDGIEDNATADQSDAEIKTAYENNTDTNAYTDADQAKLASLTETQTILDSIRDMKIDRIISIMGGSVLTEVSNTSGIRDITVTSRGRIVAVGNTDGVDSNIFVGSANNQIPEPSNRWAEKTAPVNLALNSVISFYDSSIFRERTFAVGDSGTILYNDNNLLGAGGWTLQTTPTSDSLRSVETNGTGTLIAVGASSILRSTDLGTTWDSITHPTIDPLWKVVYGNGVWIAGSTENTGDASSILRSTDDGLSWTKIDMTSFGALSGDECRYIATDRQGNWAIATVTSGESTTNSIYTSSDDGLTWTFLTIPSFSTIKSLTYIREGIWCVSASNSNTGIFKFFTTDGYVHARRLEFSYNHFNIPNLKYVYHDETKTWPLILWNDGGTDKSIAVNGFF